MKYIKISAKVEDRIDSLYQSGKTGKVVAGKALNIIENIKSGAITECIEQVGTCTKYGEKRIKNCHKFDFGSGYRMITLLSSDSGTIFIPFLGTHDECQRWLENNRKVKNITAGRGKTFTIRTRDAENSDFIYDGSDDFCEDEVSMNISEQDLRIVFCGLVEGAKKDLGKREDI